tara:strand:+ start:5044 stop:6282 length:1239 start_codon:yes stop_codon:yes gene_type:complete
MHVLPDSPKFMSLRANLGWNFFGQLIAKGSLLLFHIVFANLIGTSNYGAFSFIFVGGLILLQPFLDLGLNQLITKWVSRGNVEVIPLSFRIKGLITLLLIPLVCIISFWMGSNQILTFTMLCFFLINTVQQSIFGILRGLQDLRPESLTVSFQNILACFILIFFVVHQIAEVWVGSLILMVTRFTGTIFVSIIFWRKYNRHLKRNKNEKFILDSSQLWRESLTLGFTLFLIQFYFRIDSIMLGLLSSEIELGLYSVAFNLMEGSFIIPTIVMSVIFPGLSNNKYFSKFFKRGLFILTIAGIICGTVVFFLADFMIYSFYEASFKNSSEILEILSLAIPLVFWGYLMTQSLVALDRNRIYLVITSSGLLINVILNFLLIPEYGASGAAFSTVVTEALIPLICFLIILKYQFSK